MRLSGLTIAATIAIGFAVAACGPSVTSPSPSRAAVATDPIDLTDPTAAAAEARLLAAWRPAPLPISDDLRDSIAFLCRNAGDADANAAMAKLDVAVVDARGAGLASMILADDTVAFECRVKLETVGGTLGATIIEAPSRLAPSSAESLGDDGITVVSHSRVDEDGGSRTIAIGRLGPKAYEASVGFNDEKWFTASKGGGWWYIWWPGMPSVGAIVTADSRRVVLQDVPSPATEIEGRVTAADWWLDPAKAPLAPKATTIPALIQEQVCASGRSPKGRVVEPVVFSSEAAVLVTIWIRRLTGRQDCPANPPFAVTIKLDAPIGDRKLLDGGRLPPRDASEPPPD